MQTRACPHCGAPVPMTDRFCGECGKPVDSEPLAQAPQVPPVAPPAQPVMPPPYTPPPAMAYPPPAYAPPPAAAAPPRKGMGLSAVLLIGAGLLVCAGLVCGGLWVAGVFNPGPPATTVPATAVALSTASTEPPAPTAAPVATSTPRKLNPTTRPSSTPRPSATTRPSSTPSASSGDVLFSDDFSDPDFGGWATFSTADANIEIASGELIISVTKTNWVAYVTNQQDLDDGLLGVNVSWVDGPASHAAGIVFRRTSGDYYVFWISAAGEYSLWLHENNTWTSLIGWTASDRILTSQGDVNTLAVGMQGSVFLLGINGEVVDTAMDAALTSGEYGMIGGTYDEPDVTFAFDNFLVQTISGE